MYRMKNGDQIPMKSDSRYEEQLLVYNLPLNLNKSHKMELKNFFSEIGILLLYSFTVHKVKNLDSKELQRLYRTLDSEETVTLLNIRFQDPDRFKIYQNKNEIDLKGFSFKIATLDEIHKFSEDEDSEEDISDQEFFNFD